MEIKETGKGIKDRLHGAVDSVKSSVRDVKLPDIKAPDVKELFRRKKDGQPEKSVSEQSEEILQNTEPDDSEAEGISSDTSEETSETNSSQQKNQDEEKTGDNNGKSREKRINLSFSDTVFTARIQKQMRAWRHMLCQPCLNLSLPMPDCKRLPRLLFCFSYCFASLSISHNNCFSLVRKISVRTLRIFALLYK